MTDMTLIFDAYTAYLADVTATVSPILVLDGPQVVWPTDQDFVVVGSDDLLTTGMVVAVDNGGAAWEDLGAMTRRETFTISATYVAWTGSTDPGALADCRARAKASIDLIGASLRTPPAGTGDGMLSNTLNQVRAGWCGMYVGKLMQIASASIEFDDGTTSQPGTAIHVPFYLDCVAYL